MDKALEEHLMDKKTYIRIIKDGADKRIKTIKMMINHFINNSNLSESDKIYLNRYLKTNINNDPYSYFYLLIKVHKTPWKTRPIVSISGSVNYAISKWLDGELQKVIQLLPFTIK